MSKHFKCEPGKDGLTVIVNSDKFDKSLRIFKKKVLQDGILRELRDRQEYLKPSVRKRLKRKEAIRRRKKMESFSTNFD